MIRLRHKGHHDYHDYHDYMDVVCECGIADCDVFLKVTKAEYEDNRAATRKFRRGLAGGATQPIRLPVLGVCLHIANPDFQWEVAITGRTVRVDLTRVSDVAEADTEAIVAATEAPPHRR